MLTLKFVTERPCESVVEAIQAALDLETGGSEPLAIMDGDKIVVDGRALRRQMSELCSI